MSRRRRRATAKRPPTVLVYPLCACGHRHAQHRHDEPAFSPPSGCWVLGCACAGYTPDLSDETAYLGSLVAEKGRP